MRSPSATPKMATTTKVNGLLQVADPGAKEGNGRSFLKCGTRAGWGLWPLQELARTRITRTPARPLNHRNGFLAGLEARSPRSRGRSGWFLWRLRPLVWGRLVCPVSSWGLPCMHPSRHLLLEHHWARPTIAARFPPPCPRPPARPHLQRVTF